MPEQPKSLESQIQMARPKRHEVKRVPLTPEEKAFLGEIMDKAVAAEKAGDLAEAIGFYTDYKNELLKIKEKKEKPSSKMTEQEKFEAAKEALESKPLTKPFEDMVTNAKFVFNFHPERIDFVDSNGDLLFIPKRKKKIFPFIVGFQISNHTERIMGFHDLFTTEDGLKIGKRGAVYYPFDQNFKLLAEPAISMANINNDVFIKRGGRLKSSTTPTKLQDLEQIFQESFIEKPDGLYWKEAVS